MKYICSSCGKEHEQWPALAYSAPASYNGLTDDEQNTLAELSSDFCIINYPDEPASFIRCTLTQKVVDHCESLEYGLWVSLSKKSFVDYSDNFNNNNHLTQYFGWLNNFILGYDDTTGVPTTVRTKAEGNRPEIIPHEDFDHPFVKDYYHGISKVEAERRIDEMLKAMVGKIR